MYRSNADARQDYKNPDNTYIPVRHIPVLSAFHLYPAKYPLVCFLNRRAVLTSCLATYFHRRVVFFVPPPRNLSYLKNTGRTSPFFFTIITAEFANICLNRLIIAYTGKRLVNKIFSYTCQSFVFICKKIKDPSCDDGPPTIIKILPPDKPAWHAERQHDFPPSRRHNSPL